MEMMRKIPSLELFKADAFRMQQIAFCVLTLFVLGLLLLLHTAFAFRLGEPSTPVILVLGIGFSLKFLEIVWLQGQANEITEKTARRETAISIVGIFILAGILAFLTDRDDSPYFVLLAIPILECAYQFGLATTVLTIASSIAMMFWWTQHFFALHPPPRPTEYLETGMISIIYALIGILVWLLVHQLKQQQSRLCIPIFGVKIDCECDFGADLAGFPLQIGEVTLTSLLVMLRSDAQIAKKCRNCL